MVATTYFYQELTMITWTKGQYYRVLTIVYQYHPLEIITNQYYYASRSLVEADTLLLHLRRIRHDEASCITQHQQVAQQVCCFAKVHMFDASLPPATHAWAVFTAKTH